jgi:hypothetical protein
MRKDEVMSLTWDRVHLSENVIRLEDSDVKNETGREVPLIDGLPKLLEKLRRKNPHAKYVFLSPKGEKIGSFIKAWRNACVKAAVTVKIDGHEIVSHFEEEGTYQGFLDTCFAYLTCRRSLTVVQKGRHEFNTGDSPSHGTEF